MPKFSPQSSLCLSAHDILWEIGPGSGCGRRCVPPQADGLCAAQPHHPKGQPGLVISSPPPPETSPDVGWERPGPALLSGAGS